MPRVPYVNPPKGESPVADKIRERRKNGKLIPLDCVFLNAPNIAAGYDAFVGAIRNKNSLDGALRELLILRVAALNGAAYEWKAHEPVGIKEGLTYPQLREVRDVEDVGYGPLEGVGNKSKDAPRLNSALTPLMQAALDYTDASTRAIKIPKEVFDRLRTELKSALQEVQETPGTGEDELMKKVDQQLVEVTATIGCYNLVSRFLVSLDVGDMADQEVPAAASEV